jgi:hypothetical protein
MKRKARILSLSLVLAFGASAMARADEVDVAAGSTLIDVGGDVAVAGVTGGMADPVPLFAGDNGPAVFTMDVPGVTSADDSLSPSLTTPQLHSGIRPLRPYGPPR